MSVRDEFINPPKEYSLVPFWFWNGTLEPEKLKHQMNMMIEKGIYGAFMHARAYLRTPYLEEDWWHAVDACVEEGKKKGFQPWLYDEYAWPSGTAGSTFEYGYQKASRTLSKGICNMAKGLRVVPFKAKCAEELNDQIAKVGLELLGLYEQNNLTRFNDVESVKKVKRISDISLFFQDRKEENQKEEINVVGLFICVYPNMVDYLNKDVIKLFLQETHEKYYERYGAEFGSVIPGIFFDEIYMIGYPLPWTTGFDEYFRSKKKYDLLDKLPLLIARDSTEGEKVREDYYEILSTLYENAFFKQIADWCEEHNLKLTGHTEEEIAFHPNRQGNYFKTMKHLQIPGADCHDYRYKLPRKISFHEPKLSVSVARAYGKKHAMSEAMGGAGWGCSLQEYRRGLHTLGVMGINMFILHGMYYECDHQGSQADWPASFFYQNPYWKYFNKFAEEAHRISYMNSIGDPVVRIAIYYPIHEMYSDTVNGGLERRGARISDAFYKTMYTLIEHQMDVDIIDEDTLTSANVAEGGLESGGRRIRVLLFPDELKWNETLKRFMKEFQQAGGFVLFYSCHGEDGVFPDSISRIISEYGTDRVEPEELPRVVEELIGCNVKIIEGNHEEIYVSERTTKEEDIFFLSNSDDRPKEIKLFLNVRGPVYEMLPECGQSYAIPYKSVDKGCIVSLHLKEDEAIYLVSPKSQEGVNAWKNCKMCSSEGKYLKYQIITGKWSFLPLSKEYDERWGDEAVQSDMYIPVAILSSPLHSYGKKIRICNTSWEEGSCGRHLSLWEASWITRRPHWGDDMAEEDLYFRKRMVIKKEVKSARICVLAVNHCEIFVNGEMAVELRNCLTPQIVELGTYLKQGENLLAVHVHNDNPYPDSNFSAVEEVPKDRMVSLLLEGRIYYRGHSKKEGQGQQESPDEKIRSDSSWIVSNEWKDGWETLAFEADTFAVEHDVGRCLKKENSGTWLYAWERGVPPLKPWGEFPLFGEEVTYPMEVTYQITLPIGTDWIDLPEIQGEYTCRVDGVTVEIPSEGYRIRAENRRKLMELRIQAKGPEDGLKKPVHIQVGKVMTTYESWSAAGLEWFSGRVLYTNSFFLSPDDFKEPSMEYILSWAQSNSCAEVWINHKLVDVRTWAPYRVNITDYVVQGKNHIAIIIANTAAPERKYLLVDEGMAVGWNRYWNEDNLEREGEDLVSGLMGPVRIYINKKTKDV